MSVACQLQGQTSCKVVSTFFPHFPWFFPIRPSSPHSFVDNYFMGYGKTTYPMCFCFIPSIEGRHVLFGYFLFAPTSCRIWNTQFTQNNQQMNRAHNMYKTNSPMSFIHVYFWCFLRSSPNHIPLKYRCPYYWCVGFSHVHLSLIGLIEDIKCSFQCGQMGQTSLNKSQYIDCISNIIAVSLGHLYSISPMPTLLILGLLPSQIRCVFHSSQLSPNRLVCDAMC